MILGRVGVLNIDQTTAVTPSISLTDLKFSLVPVKDGYPALYGASCVLKLSSRYCGRARCPEILCGAVTIESITEV